MIRRLLCAAGLFTLSGALAAQIWTLDRSTLAGGGELYAQSADGRMRLSGTIGQPEPSDTAARGQGWALRGGFWSSESLPPTPRLFADGFEAEASMPMQDAEALTEAMQSRHPVR